jgi:sirohydrochlorin cobaltochelatase
MSRKAIVTVSFGSSHIQAIEEGIKPVETRFKEVFQNYDVFRAFTSARIISRLKERDGIVVLDTRACLEKLANDGYSEIIVQPLHIIAGHEYQKVEQATLNSKKKHPEIVYRMGKPLLFDRTDYAKVRDVLKEHLNHESESEKAVVFMGHGSSHLANDSYRRLERQLKSSIKRTWLATLEGDLSIRKIVIDMKLCGIRNVELRPFLLTAGEHVRHDMAGEKDSWESMLKDEGFEVTVVLTGLGQNPGIRDRYVSHCVAAEPLTNEIKKSVES